MGRLRKLEYRENKRKLRREIMREWHWISIQETENIKNKNEQKNWEKNRIVSLLWENWEVFFFYCRINSFFSFNESSAFIEWYGCYLPTIVKLIWVTVYKMLPRSFDPDLSVEKNIRPLNYYCRTKVHHFWSNEDYSLVSLLPTSKFTLGHCTGTIVPSNSWEKRNIVPSYNLARRLHPNGTEEPLNSKFQGQDYFGLQLIAKVAEPNVGGGVAAGIDATDFYRLHLPLLQVRTHAWTRSFIGCMACMHHA